MTFDTEKLESFGYLKMKNFEKYVYSFRQSPGTWRTDGQTPHDWPRLCIASRSKNRAILIWQFCPSVCQSVCHLLVLYRNSFRLHHTLFSMWQLRRGHSLRGVDYSWGIKNSWFSVKSVAAKPRVSQKFPLCERLFHPETYASGSDSRHLYSIRFSPLL